MFSNVGLVARYAGKRIAYRAPKPCGNIEIACKCRDLNTNWGNVRLLLAPIVGVGTIWANEASCRIVEDTWGDGNADAPIELTPDALATANTLKPPRVRPPRVRPPR